MNARRALLVGSVLLVGCGASQSVPGPSLDGGVPTATGAVYEDLVVFTTKAAFGGDFGGLAGADEKCTTYANAAGLKGEFKAWLSDSKTDAITRVPDAGPWRKLDREGKQAAIVFANREAWQGYPEAQVGNTEFGKELFEFSNGGTTEIPYTWTGTKLGGKKSGCHCDDWTTSLNGYTCEATWGGAIGSRSARPQSEEWTFYGDNPCNARAALLCYQVP